MILTDAGPDQGPSLHNHPYTEIHIVQAGEARFFTDDEEIVVRAGEIVVVPPGVPHGFKSQGAFREIAIHDNGHFVTEWLTADD